MKLNSDSVHARKLLLPIAEKVEIFLVGCGGTGSWLAPHVVRTAKILIELQQDVTLRFCDPDMVEGKNIFRQNFCSAEIGANKAATLAHRFGTAWGISIHVIEEKFSASKFTRRMGRDTRQLIITCVDNNTARQEVLKATKDNPIWWMDTGNLKTSGQVSVGRLFSREASPLRLPGVTTWLPSPAIQFPGILKKEEADTKVDYEGMSCAEIALADEQGLSINHSVASVAAAMLMKMLVTQDLQYHCAYVSSDSGTNFSYNSPKIINSHLASIKAEYDQITGEDDEDDDFIEGDEDEFEEGFDD